MTFSKIARTLDNQALRTKCECPLKKLLSMPSTTFYTFRKLYITLVRGMYEWIYELPLFLPSIPKAIQYTLHQSFYRIQ